MPTLVFDDFNRADSSSLGTANTGQTWNQVAGPAGGLGILSNSARWTWNFPDGSSIAVIESSQTNGITKATLVNPSQMDQNFGVGWGIICRYVDANNYWRLAFYKFPGPTNQLRLQRTYSGSTSTVVDISVTIADNDVISVGYCDRVFEVFINGISQGTYDDSANPFNYGTLCGLFTDPGSDFGTFTSLKWDDFYVTTNPSCNPTYNCTAGSCVDPGDGTGTYATLADCLTGCGVTATYNCIGGQCVDPGDGTGSFSTLVACLDSGCGGGTTGINTTRFDQGIGNSWYVVLPLIDSSEELRSKVLKAVREIGKVTNASIKVYGYDVDDPIVVSDLEDGTNSETSALGLSNTTNVTQSQRVQINVPNAILHTIRIEGDDTGQSTRDTIHEIAMEQAEEGVRR